MTFTMTITIIVDEKTRVVAAPCSQRELHDRKQHDNSRAEKNEAIYGRAKTEREWLFHKGSSVLIEYLVRIPQT